MIRYIIKRVILLIPVIIAVTFIVYTLVELAPGTYVDTIIYGYMTSEDVEAVMKAYDLDRSMLYRYGKSMLHLVQGDLGTSFSTKMDVFEMYMARLPNTLILSLTAVIVGVAISLPLGILAARRAGTITDAATTAFSLAGVSMPVFWLGLLLVMLFSLRLKWLPSGNNLDGFKSLILPGICSAMTLLATSTRQTRSSMLEVLSADFLRTARAKGVPEKVIIRKHALGNALIPIVTAIGASTCVSLAGSAVIEQVFAWPGVGRMLVDGMVARDTPVIIGCCVMTTILYVIVMLIVDLLYAFIDPRIKSQYTRKKQKSISKIVTISAPETPAAEPLLAETSAEDKGIVTPSPDSIPMIATPVWTQTAIDGNAPERSRDSIFHTDDSEDDDSTEDEMSPGAQEYMTRRNKDIVLGNLSDTSDNVVDVMKKYKKRSQMGEIWHRLVRNKSALAGIIILGAIILITLGALFLSYDSVVKTNVSAMYSPPTWQYPFGTDNMGRNLFYRVLYGARYSLIIGFSAVAFAAIIGVILGSVAAYYGGVTDNIIMRVSDVLASLPGLLLGMVIMVMLGLQIQNLIIATGVAGIPHFIRISRASILTVKENEFVEAARAIGFSDMRIITTQVLPNGLSPILVQFTALLGLNVIFAASLSYLGYGIPVPTPEWGALIAIGRDHIRTSPWMTTYPGLFIMITVLGFNLLGDGLRDALDPKQKR